MVAFGTNLVPDGQVTLAITDSTGPARRIRVPAVEVTTGSYTGETLPSFVISRQTAQRLGLPGLSSPPRYLLRATRPLSDAQRDELRALRARLDSAAISWAEPDLLLPAHEQGLRSTLLALLVVAGMLALGSVAVACALAISEARQDLTTLGQLGAAPAMTRRLMAAQAWLLATLGGLLAAAIGLDPFLVLTLASWQVRPRLAIPVGPSPLAVPWTLLTVVAVAIPALAATAASLLGRSPAPLTPGEEADPHGLIANHHQRGISRRRDCARQHERSTSYGRPRGATLCEGDGRTPSSPTRSNVGPVPGAFVTVEEQPMTVPFPVSPEGGRTAAAVPVDQRSDLSAAVAALGLHAPRLVVVLVGGAGRMNARDLDRLRPLFEQGLVPVADRLGVVVIDGGTDAGVMRLMGRARTRAEATFPLVGVPAVGTVRFPGKRFGVRRRWPLDGQRRPGRRTGHPAGCVGPGRGGQRRRPCRRAGRPRRPVAAAALKVGSHPERPEARRCCSTAEVVAEQLGQSLLTARHAGRAV